VLRVLHDINDIQPVLLPCAVCNEQKLTAASLLNLLHPLKYWHNELHRCV